MPPWAFERDGEVVKVDPRGPLIVSTSGADLEIGAALKGLGIVYLLKTGFRTTSIVETSPSSWTSGASRSTVPGCTTARALFCLVRCASS